MKHQKDLNDLFNYLQSVNTPLQPRQQDQMSRYLTLLQKWSAKQNLVSGNDKFHFVERHFLPSLFLNAHLPQAPQGAMMDLGSGAGFPGVLVAIMQPDLTVTLLDSSRKKTLFLQEVSEALSLNARVICQRCEVYADAVSDKYQFIVSRAVARIDVLAGWTKGLLDKRGRLYALKGGNEKQEFDGDMPDPSAYKIIRPGKDWLDFSDYMENKYLLVMEK